MYHRIDVQFVLEPRRQTWVNFEYSVLSNNERLLFHDDDMQFAAGERAVTRPDPIYPELEVVACLDCLHFESHVA